MTTVALSDDVIARYRQGLADLRGVTVVQAPQSALLTAEAIEPLMVHTVEVDDVDVYVGRVKERGHDVVQGSALLLLVAGVLSEEVAIALEDAGQPFVDAAGRAWVPGAPRTTRSRGHHGSHLRAATTRAAQLLADHPYEEWSEPRLMRRADVGASTAHRLLRRLRDEGLITRTGTGRNTVSNVTDVSRLRRWLVATVGSQRPARLPFYVRDPSRLPDEIDGARLVRSGAQAAKLIGMPVLSGDPRPLLRIDVKPGEFEELPGLLGGVRSAEGANVLLVADPGRLARSEARRVEGVWVAPTSRICLDLLLEPRGAAAADVFLDLWNDRGV